MRPFVWILTRWRTALSRSLGYGVTGENEDAHTEEEIRLLMKESYRQGLINSTEADFVDNVFSFTELNAREIMVPRTDMICLYLDDTPAERIKTILEEQQTRYPVCYQDKDHIIGFIHVKDLLSPLVRGEHLNLRPLYPQSARRAREHGRERASAHDAGAGVTARDCCR